MKKIKLVIGNTPSHLLEAAKSLASSKRYAVIDGRAVKDLNQYSFSPCSPNTELIIIDNVQLNHLEKIVYAFYSSQIKVNKINHAVFLLEAEIIITYLGKLNHLPVSASLHRRIEVIDLNSKEKEVNDAE